MVLSTFFILTILVKWICYEFEWYHIVVIIASVWWLMKLTIFSQVYWPNGEPPLWNTYVLCPFFFPLGQLAFFLLICRSYLYILWIVILCWKYILINISHSRLPLCSLNTVLYVYWRNPCLLQGPKVSLLCFPLSTSWFTLTI